jgi:hypothetical protein
MFMKFLQVAGTSTLVFLSSEQLTLCNQLEIEKSLQGIKRNVVVALVIVEDENLFSNVAVRAA